MSLATARTVPTEGRGGDTGMTYERPAVLATYKVDELMKDAAVCTVYCARPE
jgi:hypothetical protein